MLSLYSRVMLIRRLRGSLRSSGLNGSVSATPSMRRKRVRRRPAGKRAPGGIGAGGRQRPVVGAAIGIGELSVWPRTVSRLGVSATAWATVRHQRIGLGAEDAGAEPEHREIGAFDNIDAQAVMDPDEADLAFQALQRRVAGQPRRDDAFDHAEARFVGGAAVAGCWSWRPWALRLRSAPPPPPPVAADGRGPVSVGVRRDAFFRLQRAAAHDAVGAGAEFFI